MHNATLEKIIDNSTNEFSARVITDYSEVLTKHGLNYSSVDYCYQVGETSQTQGWILHISVVRSEIIALLNTIIPFLTKAGVCFKVVKNKETARTLLDGNIGLAKVGKIVTIFTNNSRELSAIAQGLVELTKPFNGPVILTDFHLGGNVYTRYGGINPVIKFDDAGHLGKFIYNQQGQLVRDSYSIPFEIPNDEKWPFDFIDFQVNAGINSHALLNQRYKPLALLKSDAKGNVIKAFYLKKPFFIGKCVIKQGKRQMWADETGRDMRSRLEWQKQIHNDLEGIIPVPKIIDYFTEGGDAFIVMKMIKGESLHDVVNKMNKNCSGWLELPGKLRIKVLGYLLQVIDIIDRLHKSGFVHRDVTPVNFLVEKKQLYLIDNELAYSLKLDYPNPPFEFGSFGFMSPEQRSVQIPTPKEDIYGLGATMITIFTSLHPLVLDVKQPRRLSENLYFFIGNKAISDLISNCCKENPLTRPTLTSISTEIRNYQRTIVEKRNEEINLNEFGIDQQLLRTIIDGAIKGLVDQPTAILNGLWQSQNRAVPNDQTKVQDALTTLPGFANGIAGVLYVISKAKQAGFETQPTKDAFLKGSQFINDNFLVKLPNVPPGLYGGAAGISLMIATAIESGLLAKTHENIQLIYQCLNLPAAGPDLCNGAAGQGLAALKCLSYLNGNGSKLLSDYINYLTSPGQNVGYWVMLQNDMGKQWYAPSFAIGNSGITYFLLKHAAHFNDKRILRIAHTSLNIMMANLKSFKRNLSKYGLRKVEELPVTLDTFQGIMRVLILAFEVTGDELYKNVADEFLKLYPISLIHNNFMQETGLAGLGELYLEGYRVFKTKEWKLRANWIAGVFMHTYHENENHCFYWTNNNSIVPIANFLTGNSGIIHFLVRLHSNGEIKSWL